MHVRIFNQRVDPLVLPATLFSVTHKPLSKFKSKTFLTLLSYQCNTASAYPFVSPFNPIQTIGPSTAAMSATSALPEGLRAYLATCSDEHADQIIQTLRDHAGRQVPNAASKMTAHKASKIAKPAKKQRTKKPKAEVATGGPKRPLNSWMAFRSK